MSPVRVGAGNGRVRVDDRYPIDHLDRRVGPDCDRSARIRELPELRAAA